MNMSDFYNGPHRSKEEGVYNALPGSVLDMININAINSRKGLIRDNGGKWIPGTPLSQNIQGQEYVENPSYSEEGADMRRFPPEYRPDVGNIVHGTGTNKFIEYSKLRRLMQSSPSLIAKVLRMIPTREVPQDPGQLGNVGSVGPGYLGGQ